jgi:hypothetical protein
LKNGGFRRRSKFDFAEVRKIHGVEFRASPRLINNPANQNQDTAARFVVFAF